MTEQDLVRAGLLVGRLRTSTKGEFGEEDAKLVAKLLLNIGNLRQVARQERLSAFRLAEDCVILESAMENPVAEFKEHPNGNYLHLDWRTDYVATLGDRLVLCRPQLKEVDL